MSRTLGGSARVAGAACSRVSEGSWKLPPLWRRYPSHPDSSESGGLILGAALPRGDFNASIRARIETLATQLLLPLFFIYSGLNTRFDLVNEAGLWLVASVVLVAAVAGKMGACYLAARACGESHRDGLGVGALMNARGLMELIILNIGLERGLITPTLFTIMVLMAIVTTLMATPLFEAVYLRRPKLA